MYEVDEMRQEDYSKDWVMQLKSKVSRDGGGGCQ